MKTLKKHLRTIASILILLMLFQSCTVYKKTTITLDQAAQKESKVKVKIINNETLKFNRISRENGNFFGIKEAQGEITKTPLDSRNVISIKEKDESSSTIVTILAVAGSVVAIIVLAFLISGGPDIGLSWESP